MGDNRRSANCGGFELLFRSNGKPSATPCWHTNSVKILMHVS